MRGASAQEWVGTEVSAAVPTVVMGSSAARMSSLGEVETMVRAPRFAVCDADGSEFCSGLHATGVAMNLYPHWKLHLNLPAHFSLQGHMWSMSHEAVDLTLRQAIVGTTLRHVSGRDWYELGVGMAERAEAEHTHGEGAGGCDPGPVRPALLAGVGTWFNAGNHMFFDLRVSGGVDVGDASPDVFHANLVLAFLWQ